MHKVERFSSLDKSLRAWTITLSILQNIIFLFEGNASSHDTCKRDIKKKKLMNRCGSNWIRLFILSVGNRGEHYWLKGCSTFFFDDYENKKSRNQFVSTFLCNRSVINYRTIAHPPQKTISPIFIPLRFFLATVNEDRKISGTRPRF